MIDFMSNPSLLCSLVTVVGSFKTLLAYLAWDAGTKMRNGPLGGLKGLL